MRILPTASAILFGILTAGSLSVSQAAAQDFDSGGEQQMLARINAMRAAQQLAPVSRHAGLDTAARAHSSDMAAQRALTHVSQTTGTPADRVRRTGVSATTIAENVALHRSADEAHQALLGSDAHRANMMSPDITHIGLAALRTEQGVYVTQVFAAVPSAAPQVQAPEAPAPQAPPQAPVQRPRAPVAPAPPPLVAAPDAPAPPDAAPDGDGCVTPFPGVRLCGRFPGLPQSDGPVARVEPPPVAPLPPPPPVAPQQVAPPDVSTQGQLVVQPGSNGTVLVQHMPDGRVGGYWVYSSSRWWYYPMPEGAQPGQQLQPDLRVSGPPPGFPAHPFGPQAPPMAPRPQAWGVAPIAPPPPPQSGVMLDPRAGTAQITIAPGVGSYYAVPPPPMMGQPDRAWRRAHGHWTRAYQRWLRDQARLRRQAL